MDAREVCKRGKPDVLTCGPRILAMLMGPVLALTHDLADRWT